MKKILFLEQFSNISGGQKMLLTIVGGLDRKKFDPVVALPEKGELSDELEKLGVKYHVIPVGAYSAGKKNILDALSYFIRSIILVPITFRLIKNGSIDIVYCNAPRTFLWGTLAAKAARKPVAWHLHSIFSGIELKLCKLSLLLGVDKVIAISKAVVDPFTRDLTKNKDRFQVIYNGIDTEKYSKKFDSAQVRKEFGIPENCNIVGYIGQLTRWKGVEDLIRAAKEVLLKKSDTRFLIIGDVLFDSDKKAYKDHLYALVRELGISDRVIFTGQRSDVPRLLSAIDLLAVPSRDPEPLSLALLEAMASGKTVVASDQGGPAEIIKDGWNGRLFKPGDHASLSKVIQELLSDKEKSRKIGDEARRDVAAKYSTRDYLAKIENVLSGL